MVVEGKRVKVSEDSDGRSVLSFEPAMSNDAGIYKVVARNRVRTQQNGKWTHTDVA